MIIISLGDDKSGEKKHQNPEFGFSYMDDKLQRNKVSWTEFSQWEKSIFIVPSGLLRLSESQNMKPFLFQSVKH